MKAPQSEQMRSAGEICYMLNYHLKCDIDEIKAFQRNEVKRVGSDKGEREDNFLVR